MAKQIVRELGGSGWSYQEETPVAPEGLPSWWTVTDSQLLLDVVLPAADYETVFAIGPPPDHAEDGNTLQIQGDGSLTMQLFERFSGVTILLGQDGDTISYDTPMFSVGGTWSGVNHGVLVDKRGRLTFYNGDVHTAPANADLSSGSLALWFDSTNGAAKLMLKGKTENGTVVTGQVTLA